MRVTLATEHERGLREILHPARDHNLCLTQHDHLRSGDNGLRAAAAQAVEGEHGHLLRYACVEPGVPGPVDGLA